MHTIEGCSAPLRSTTPSPGSMENAPDFPMLAHNAAGKFAENWEGGVGAERRDLLVMQNV